MWGWLLCAGLGLPLLFGAAILAYLGWDRLRLKSDARAAAEYLRGKQVVVIGSGFSGLAAAVHCRRAGIQFVVLEKAAAVGGTWRQNQYPGCECDIRAHLYAFSFFPNTEWSSSYPSQPEIHAYLQRVAREEGLLPCIRFNSEVKSCVWDSQRNQWDVRYVSGGNGGNNEGLEQIWADFVVSAAGPLDVPVIPPLRGKESFPGLAFHSAHWPGEPLKTGPHAPSIPAGGAEERKETKEATSSGTAVAAGDNLIGHSPSLDNVELRGRRVAIVGSAASAVQLLPEVATRAKEVVLFQRTPSWVGRKDQFRYAPETQARFRRHPWLMKAYRWFLYLNQEWLYLLVFGKGSWLAMLGERILLKRMRRHLRDKPDYVELLRPNYPMGCKRILNSNHYFKTLNQPHVRLVPEELAEIRGSTLLSPKGVEVPEVDIIVYATGFNPLAICDFAHVQGLGGVTLQSLKRDPAAYLGTSVPGFPNFFLLLGPNAGLGHNTVVWMAECQVEYIMGLWARMGRRGLRTLDMRPAALAEYYARLSRQMNKMVWSTGCHSWYKINDDKDGSDSTQSTGKEKEKERKEEKESGKTPVFALWPFSTAYWWWCTRSPTLEPFETA